MFSGSGGCSGRGAREVVGKVGVRLSDEFAVFGGFLYPPTSSFSVGALSGCCGCLRFRRRFC